LAVDGALLTVQTNYAVFEIVGLAIVEGGIYLLLDQLPVVGVHQLHQLIDGGFDLFRLVAVDAESIVGPEHFTSL
jgi:hypothetical protein